MFHDLIYAGSDVEDIIKKQYPHARIKDASDFIHTERFECEIDDVDADEFYPFAIQEGFARCCFGFELLMGSLKFKELKTGLRHEATIAKIKGWVAKAKEVKENANSSSDTSTGRL